MIAAAVPCGGNNHGSRGRAVVPMYRATCRPERFQRSAAAHGERLEMTLQTTLHRVAHRRALRSLRAVLTATVVVGLSAGVLAPSVAEAAARTPAKPSGIRVAASAS